MPPTAAAQAAYNDFLTDKYRANCLTIRDPGECVTCLKKQVSSADYSQQVLNDVCARPEAHNSPRRACGKDDVWTICNCPGGMQNPPPPGKSPIAPTVQTCTARCHPDNIPICTMGEGNPLGDGYIVGSEYIKNISNKCKGSDTDVLTWGWGTPLVCDNVDKEEIDFSCNDGQWGVQVNNRGDRYAGINNCVTMDPDEDDECYDKSKGGTCKDDCLTNIFYNTTIYKPYNSGQRTNEKGGNGSVWRTVKVPIDEIIFESNVEDECEEIEGTHIPGEQISYKCAPKIGTGYSTIMCNGEQQGIVVGNYGCPRVDCLILGGLPWQQLVNCQCNEAAPDLPGIPNMVGEYVIGKYHMRDAQQGEEDVNWYRCHDQSLATDRTVTSFIGDDDNPSIS
jgi:hypothetical protein